jgi:O-antigen biosynthesis protein WbqP
VKRVFDFFGLLDGSDLFLPVLLVVVAVRLTSKVPALYWSDRVGRNSVIFKMQKFRRMRAGTPAVATHQLRMSVHA